MKNITRAFLASACIASITFTSGCKPSEKAPEKAESAKPTQEAAKAPETPPGFSMSESFDGDAAALRQKGLNIPSFASVVGDIPGANGKTLRV